VVGKKIDGIYDGVDKDAVELDVVVVRLCLE